LSLTFIAPQAFEGCGNITSVGPGFNPVCYVAASAFFKCSQLQAAAKTNRYASIVEYGKDVGRPCHLRWAVLATVQTARRLMDAACSSACPPALKIHPVLYLLASVPSGENNKSPLTEGQVLRNIVSYIGAGFSGFDTPAFNFDVKPPSFKIGAPPAKATSKSKSKFKRHRLR
jgi:hypothetical protein